MATRIGGYLFKREGDFEAAKGAIYNQIYEDYYDSNRISFYGSYGDGYLIEIYNECSNPKLVGQICSSYGGEPYNKPT